MYLSGRVLDYHTQNPGFDSWYHKKEGKSKPQAGHRGNTHVVPATWEAMAGESFEDRSLRTA
jgi:hypothetical protein